VAKITEQYKFSLIKLITNGWIQMVTDKTYTPIGTVVRGFDIVKDFNGKYQDTITFKYQDSVMKYGNKYLEKYFPGLDKIKKTKIK
jgi:predicted AlkP superfamily phosphohydrolase/phosphomutase